MLALFAFTSMQAQDKQSQGYVFTDDIRVPVTSVKNQYRSSTCWSFSGLSFLEAELLKAGKGDFDLSEMFIVNHTYKDKAERYVRMHGNLNFGGGGAFHDVTYVLKNYGLVPEEAYKGLHYGTKNHVHGELDQILKSFVEGVIKNRNKTLSPTWKKAFDLLLDSYLGALPEKFTYKGKSYTPKSFAHKYLNLNADNYVEISSFTHHPFYGSFIIEVPDNWLWSRAYNVPLDEMLQIIDHSLEKGHTVAWAADVSHRGFSHSKGIAVIPETEVENMDGLERAKWEKVDTRQRMKDLYSLQEIVPEKKITQEMRQKAFDNYQTTDDHGMLIVGKAHDSKNNKYYIIKNSWGESGKYKGYFYASEAFVKLQTTCIMVNKKMIPSRIASKLKI